jgi:hypothetical protein
MALRHAVHCSLEDGWLKGAKAEYVVDVVEGVLRGELVQEPESLLGERQRNRRFAGSGREFVLWPPAFVQQAFGQQAFVWRELLAA